MQRAKLRYIVMLYEESKRLRHNEESIYEKCVLVPNMAKFREDKERKKRVA